MSNERTEPIVTLEKWSAKPQSVLTGTLMDGISLYERCLNTFRTDILLQTVRDSSVLKRINDTIRAVHTMKGNSDDPSLFSIIDVAVSILTDLRANTLPAWRNVT